MRHGDISAEPAPGVGFRFDRLIQDEDGKVNKDVRAFMQSIWRLDVSIWIISTQPRRHVLLFLVKWGVVYNHVVHVESTLEIPSVVRANDLLYYYDTDMNVLLNVESRGNGKVKVKKWTSDESF